MSERYCEMCRIVGTVFETKKRECKQVETREEFNEINGIEEDLDEFMDVEDKKFEDLE